VGYPMLANEGCSGTLRNAIDYDNRFKTYAI
jgi:hypothetical protein